MTTKTTFLASVTAAAIATGLLVAPVAEARGGPQQRGDMQAGPSFSELDVDGSGGITAEDLEAMKAARFAEVDADGDGTVTADELTAHRTARAEEQRQNRSEQMISRLDTDGDGVLSQDELAGGQREGRNGSAGKSLIDRADADGDGQVSEEEFEAAKAAMKERGDRRRGDERRGQNGRDQHRGKDHARNGQNPHQRGMGMQQGAGGTPGVFYMTPEGGYFVPFGGFPVPQGMHGGNAMPGGPGNGPGMGAAPDGVQDGAAPENVPPSE